MEDWEKEFLRTAIRSRPVFKAAREGHEGEVARLLDADATLLEAMDSDGDRLLAVAAEHGHLGLVRLLLQRGADAAVRVRWASFNMNEFWASKGTQIFGGTTPLIIACDKGHMAVLQLLLEHRQGQGLEEKDDVWGRTALHSAAQRGHEEVTAYLLDNGAQADSRDDNSSTPLIIASKNGHLGVVRVLVQHIGAHNLIGTQGLEARDKGGMTALAWAAEQGYEEMVAFLLLKGALADRLDNTRDTPFLKACAKGHLGVVQMLLEHVGVEQGLQGRGRYSRTALHHAAANGHEDVAAFLFSKGADASARNAHGETPLMLACRAGRAGMVSRILRHTGGLGLDESDDSGRTAVRHAIEEARKEILSLLLLAGADPTIAGNDGTPRDIAQNRGSRKDWAGCVEVLDRWEREPERRRILYRATRLHETYAMQRDRPMSQVPTYLKARVAAGHAVPGVEVVPLESTEREEQGETSLPPSCLPTWRLEWRLGMQCLRWWDRSRRCKQQKDETHAMLDYVLKELNEELLHELLGAFH